MNIVIAGAGEVGRHLAESLSSQLHNICLIESSDRLAAELNERLDIQIIQASGSSVTALAEANAAECDLFLALTSEDNTNLVAASLAKSMGAGKTIARVHGPLQREEWLFDFKTHFGIDYLFSSARLTAIELAKFVRNPERLLVEELARGRIELQQTFVSPDSKAVGRSISSLGLPPRVRIASIERGGRHLIPAAQDTLEGGDRITLFGEPMKLAKTLPLLQPDIKQDTDVNVVIFGGGEYGVALAQMLEGRRYRVRVMEQDAKLCRRLSGYLQRTVVINSDATSLQELKEEQVGAADFFIAASEADEDNVMTCLQAKNLGAKYCLALIHRADYAELVSENSEVLGILGAVSPRVATSRDLLRFVNSDAGHVVMKLGEHAEVLEVTAGKKSGAVGHKVSEIRWPSGSGLVALLHGNDAIVPTGDDVIEAGDTVYAMVTPSARRAFLRILT